MYLQFRNAPETAIRQDLLSIYAIIIIVKKKGEKGKRHGQRGLPRKRWVGFSPLSIIFKFEMHLFVNRPAR